MKAAVLGSPISHSLSPILHQSAYRNLGLSHTYLAIDVKAENFVKFFENLDNNWLGFSLTMPLKEVAFEVATDVSELAQQTGAINTLVIGEKIYADNTDVYGLSKALREAGCANPRTATVVGAGATARSAIAALAGLGVETVMVLARNPIKCAACIDLGNELGIILDATSSASSKLFQSDVVINTTPAGVADEYLPLIDNFVYSKTNLKEKYLLDVIYHPWPTKIIEAWQKMSGKIVPGYEVLLHQAARQVELMTGTFPNTAHMRVAMLEALANR